MAAFQRNVFRVCGLVVIVMGTDAKISCLIAQSGDSYHVWHKWMSIVPQFPSYQIVLHAEAERQAWSRAVERYPVV